MQLNETKNPCPETSFSLSHASSPDLHNLQLPRLSHGLNTNDVPLSFQGSESRCHLPIDLCFQPKREGTISTVRSGTSGGGSGGGGDGGEGEVRVKWQEMRGHEVMARQRGGGKKKRNKAHGARKRRQQGEAHMKSPLWVTAQGKEQQQCV